MRNEVAFGRAQTPARLACRGVRRVENHKGRRRADEPPVGRGRRQGHRWHPEQPRPGDREAFPGYGPDFRYADKYGYKEQPEDGLELKGRAKLRSNGFMSDGEVSAPSETTPTKASDKD